jgi:hypothetical protein
LISPQITADASVLQFNFLPPPNVLSVTFKYVFASEEYPENVASAFDDVFGLFVDGQNVALIPGTTTPISINTLNATATPSLFINNFAAIFGTQFDGFSAVLTATVAVTPGVSRQISLAIADGTDRLGDSAVFVAPVTVTGFFDDVPLAHFAFSHVQAIFGAGITTGCSANPLLFCPDNNVTRGEMAAFIARAINGGDPAGPCATPPFTDVPVTDPFCPHVQFIKNRGVSLGFTDGTFRPLDVVTRGQIAAFLIRGVEGEPVGPCTVAPFPDVPIGHTFCRHIERLKARAITLGFPDGTYRPENGTLRDEMAIFLGRAFLGLQ